MGGCSCFACTPLDLLNGSVVVRSARVPRCQAVDAVLRPSKLDLNPWGPTRHALSHCFRRSYVAANTYIMFNYINGLSGGLGGWVGGWVRQVAAPLPAVAAAA